MTNTSDEYLDYEYDNNSIYIKNFSMYKNKNIIPENNKLIWNSNDLEVNTENIPSQITKIFGENESTTYDGQNDNWVGSLTTLENGKRYSFGTKEPFIWDLLTPIFIDTYSEQEWLPYTIGGNYYGQTPYYPVLPKYGADGNFIENDFPNNKIPFPSDGQITDENENNKNLLINITSEKIEGNSFNDVSGNSNFGMVISDYRPEFDNKTLEPKKKKTFDRLKTSSKNGAF